MRIGIPKEVKDQEFRVGMTPGLCQEFVREGHEVLVESDAGTRIGFTDELYEASGCRIVPTAKEVWQSELIIKVKEPQNQEFPLMHEGQTIFGFFHLSPDPEQTRQLLEQNVIAIAYETVTDDFGHLPLLVPMSEIAGRISVQAGAHALHMVNGGKGVLLGGVPGVSPAKVVIIGGGIVGTEAARMAMGLGADVTVLDRNLRRIRQLDELYGPRLKTLYSNPVSIEEAVIGADLVIGAVLIPGQLAPRLITKKMIETMQPGSVLVDVAIDQGGCAETSRPTTHSNPTYIVDDVVHYCVANMPGACSCTATQALTNATYRHALAIANLGPEEAMKKDPHLRAGLNIHKGRVTHPSVAADLGYDYVPVEEVL